MVKVIPVYINSTGIILKKGDKKQLKVKNDGSDVTWESLDTSIATVSSTGLVKAKKTGSGNGRYKGIDHVEMFIGYAYAGMDYDGTSYLTTKLAARSDGYGYGMLVVRPKK